MGFSILTLFELFFFMYDYCTNGNKKSNLTQPQNHEMGVVAS